MTCAVRLYASDGGGDAATGRKRTGSRTLEVDGDGSERLISDAFEF